jgi:P pilus assembly chaperone PapD
MEIMKTKNLLTSLIVVFLSIIAFCEVSAQITIAPTNLFIDSGNRFGSYLVINNSNEPYEVSIDFIFGYSDSDEEGNRFMTYEDSVTAEKYSIVDWVRAFPQNLTLSPGQRQVIRLRINAPSNIEQGTYWARIVTSATPQSQPIEIQNENVVSANIEMRINQITGIFYKNGNVNTNITIDNISTQVDGDELAVVHDLSKGGNSPFFGSINVKILDSTNNQVKEFMDYTVIYFDTKLKSTFDISDLPSGRYNIEISIASKRQDIANDDLIQMEPVTATTTVIID